MSTNRTTAQIIDTVRELANENPDFVYERPLVENAHGVTVESSRCQYLHADGPGCIMGHALSRQGISVPVSFEGKGINDVLRAFGFAPTDEQARWLNNVQRSQDKGNAWSFAVVDGDMAVEAWQQRQAYLNDIVTPKLRMK